MNRIKMGPLGLRSYRALILLVLIVLLMVCANVLAEYKQPQVIVTPETALIDRKVTIQLFNFIPDQIVTVNLRLNYERRQWSSHATFQVGRQGMVDLSRQPSIGGSYQGVDPMGLFRTLVPEEERMDDTSSNILLITATINNHLIAAKQYIPTLIIPGTIKKIVRSDGLVGTFYYPSGSRTHPGVIMLSGAEGGLNETRAAVLASHGYATLALAYFGMESLPPELSKIRIEYVQTALNWLQSQPMVDKNRIAVIGASKGAELALLSASYFPSIRAVVAYAPSAVVWQGMDPEKQISSWVYRGRQLPYVPYQFSTAASFNSFWSEVTNSPKNTSLVYSASLKNQAAVNKALIPVEKIKGPVLLISGKNDHVWPSSQMAEMIMARLQKFHHPYPDKNLSYASAGHITEWFYLPSLILKPNQKIDWGGNPLSNSRAGSSSWGQVLRFLEIAFATNPKK